MTDFLLLTVNLQLFYPPLRHRVELNLLQRSNRKDQLVRVACLASYLQFNREKQWFNG